MQGTGSLEDRIQDISLVIKDILLNMVIDITTGLEDLSSRPGVRSLSQIHLLRLPWHFLMEFKPESITLILLFQAEGDIHPLRDHTLSTFL
jgi:hypothetical protein